MTFRAMNVIDNFVLDVGGTTAVGLVSAVPALDALGRMSGRTVYRVMVSVDDDAVRWRADGVDPTATVGHPIEDGGTLSLTGANYKNIVRNIKFIAVAATAAIFGTAFD